MANVRPTIDGMPLTGFDRERRVLLSASFRFLPPLAASFRFLRFDPLLHPRSRRRHVDDAAIGISFDRGMTEFPVDYAGIHRIETGI